VAKLTVAAAANTVDGAENVFEHTIVEVRLTGVEAQAVDKEHKRLESYEKLVLYRTLLGSTTEHMRLDATRLLRLQLQNPG